MAILVVPKGESVSKLGRDRAKVRRRKDAKSKTPRRLPGGGVSLPYNPTTGAVVGGALGATARETRAKTHSNRHRLPRGLQQTLDEIRMGKHSPKGPA